MRGFETILIHPSLGRGQKGDITYDTAREVQSCIIWPRTSEEEGRGEVIIEGLNVFVPPDATPPGPNDRVTARGEDFDVDGMPGRYDLGVRTRGYLVVLKKIGT